MSLTANLPNGGYCWKTYTHNGFWGSILTIAASWVFTNLGFASNSFPVRLSTFCNNSLNLHAICDVWQSQTGVYPACNWPGWFNTITWASKVYAYFGGSFLLSPTTYPLLISLIEVFFKLNPMLSPGSALVNC